MNKQWIFLALSLLSIICACKTVLKKQSYNESQVQAETSHSIKAKDSIVVQNIAEENINEWWNIDISSDKPYTIHPQLGIVLQYGDTKLRIAKQMLKKNSLTLTQYQQTQNSSLESIVSTTKNNQVVQEKKLQVNTFKSIFFILLLAVIVFVLYKLRVYVFRLF